MMGGKPVIYLFPPSPLPRAHVSVTLVPQWSFTHAYPLVAPKCFDDRRQTLNWSVSAEPHGAPIESKSGTELIYLFWNDFITYWLPKLSKRPYVAIRFLSQAAYERAAALEVVPPPDVVTHVFMLFRGVKEDEVVEWAAARARATFLSVDWAKVVCVKAEAWDKGFLRVL